MLYNIKVKQVIGYYLHRVRVRVRVVEIIAFYLFNFILYSTLLEMLKSGVTYSSEP